MIRVDRDGFERYIGIQVFHAPKSPFISLGVHLDWHTPYISFHIGRMQILIGKTQWGTPKQRFTYYADKADGHTEMCTCWDLESGEFIARGQK